MSCTTTKKGLTSVIFNCLSYNLTVISVNYILSHKLTHFQSNTREVDLDLTREQYMSDIYRLNDFLFHIGNYNYRIVSAIPGLGFNGAQILPTCCRFYMAALDQ